MKTFFSSKNNFDPFFLNFSSLKILAWFLQKMWNYQVQYFRFFFYKLKKNKGSKNFSFQHFARKWDLEKMNLQKLFTFFSLLWGQKRKKIKNFLKQKTWDKFPSSWFFLKVKTVKMFELRNRQKLKKDSVWGFLSKRDLFCKLEKNLMLSFFSFPNFLTFSFFSKRYFSNFLCPPKHQKIEIYNFIFLRIVGKNMKLCMKF